MKKSLGIITILLALAWPAVPPAGAQDDARAVDKVFAQWNQPDSPGCALSVIRDGKIIYKRGYGMADLEHDIPITPASVFYVGSVSKQFTAFAVAQLAREGKISLDDNVRKYLPELPDYGTPITVRHLIHHTSGLRDINTLMSLAGRRGDEAFDNQDVLEVAARQKELNFKPGDQYLYSNTGYACLALIVERASGRPFADFAEARIFKPLGMDVTHYHTDQARLVRHRAYAYEPKKGGGFALDTPVNERAGAGGVFTTVEELLHWDQNFYDGRVGGMELIKEIQTPGKLNDSKQLDYAFGLTITEYKGLRLVEHGGSLGGYRAAITRFPDQHFSVACLCNLGTISPTNLTKQVAEVYLAGQFKLAAEGAARQDQRPSGWAELNPIPLTEEQLLEYAGNFHSDELNVTYEIRLDGGKLFLRHRRAPVNPLVPTARDVFRLDNLQLHYARDNSSRISGFTLDAGRVKNLRFLKSARK